MTEPDKDPQFPQYQNPGLQMAQPHEAKPLKKLMKFLLKPKDPFHSRRPKHKKLKSVKYY